MSFISFALDQYRLPVFEVDDLRYQPLGGWIITDISRDMLACLDALAMADDVTNGRAPFEPWSSENYEVSFTPDGFVFRNEWVEGDEARYSVPEIREALETYWHFLAALPERRQLVREYHPELPEWQADLLRWEEKWGRPHPYRGRLF
ncbi:hypothetical protein ACIBOV_07000 [Micromonospora chersina]|uniref:hypothetical protein n=1 Tax=Micromonospora chersina TaxID=47854 RepID=UPI0037B1A721